MWKMNATPRKMMTGHQPAPMAANESSRLPIGWPFVYQSATPRAETIMPSVAMKAGIFVYAMSEPLMARHKPAEQARRDRKNGVKAGQARIDGVRVALGLRQARRDHRRHADDRPRRQVDSAHDDDLSDADRDDADLRLLQDHDLEAQRIGDEALADENPAQG